MMPRIFLLICCLLASGLTAHRQRKEKQRRQDKCIIRLHSNESMNGTVSTPNYPHSYTENMVCYYYFKGTPSERVQLIFTDFDLAAKEDNIGKMCEGTDRLDAFLVTTGDRERINRFCGDTIPKALMSSGPYFRLEFYSFSRPHRLRARGFHAFYRFLKNLGIESGEQQKDEPCKFIYRSKDYPYGTISSPNHPGLYPRNTLCHYIFYGAANQKIAFTFPYFQVDGKPPCTTESASDYVEFSNFPTMDRKIPLACGDLWPRHIISDGSYFRISFRSNNEFDGTGFMAHYQFRNASEVVRAKRLRLVSASSTLSTNISGWLSLWVTFLSSWRISLR